LQFSVTDCCTCEVDPLKFELKFTSNCKVVFFVLPDHGVRSPAKLKKIDKLIGVAPFRPSITGASRVLDETSHFQTSAPPERSYLINIFLPSILPLFFVAPQKKEIRQATEQRLNLRLGG
jgi:hypothetical protein